MSYTLQTSSAFTANNLDFEGEIYVDVETLRLSHEVPGGWKNIQNFGVAVVVTWDSLGQYRAWYEEDTPELLDELRKFNRVVTFNGERFDLTVLSAYGDVNHLRAHSFDVLVKIVEKLGVRVKLDSVVHETLGLGKSGDGLDAVRWWRQGLKDKVTEYCRRDVELLLRLVAHAREKGFIVIDRRKIEVDWSPLAR